MKIRFIEPKTLTKRGQKVKVTGHIDITGKIFFSQGAVEKYNITNNTYFRIGIDRDKPKKKILYLQKTNETDSLARRIFFTAKKAGLSAAYALFELKLDFRNKKFKVIIDDVKIEGNEYLRLKFVEKKDTENKDYN